MKESGISRGRKTVVGCNSGSMAASMKDTGNLTKQMVEAASSTPTETCTTENGKMTKPMDSAATTTQMEPNMKVTGTKTSNTVRVRKYGQMEPTTKDVTTMERNMAPVNSTGQTVAPTPALLLTTTSTAMECTHGPMGGNTPENGI